MKFVWVLDKGLLFTGGILSFILLTWLYRSIEFHTALLVAVSMIGFGLGTILHTPHSIFWIFLIYYILVLPPLYKMNFRKFFKLSSLEKAFLLFLIWITLTTFYSTNPFLTGRRALAFWAFFAFFKLFKHIIHCNRLELSKFYGLTSMLGGIILFWSLYWGYIKGLGAYTRIGSFWSHPNALGQMSYLIGGLSVLSLFHRKYLLISLLVLVLSIIGLLLSASRGSILAFLVVFELFVFFLPRQKFKHIIAGLPIGIGLWLLLSEFVLPLAISLFPGNLARLIIEGKFAHYFLLRGVERFDLWQYILHHQWKSLLMGFGFGAVTNIKRGYEWLARGGGAHNVFLQLLLDTGIIGFSIYLSFLLRGLKVLSRTIKYAKKEQNTEILGAMALVLGMLTNSFFESGITLAPALPHAFLFYLFFMIAEDYILQRRKRNKSELQKAAVP